MSQLLCSHRLAGIIVIRPLSLFLCVLLAVFNFFLTKRDRKTVEIDFPAIANCFGYTLLQRLLSYTEEAQEHILELGNIIVLMNVIEKKFEYTLYLML